MNGNFEKVVGRHRESNLPATQKFIYEGITSHTQQLSHDDNNITGPRIMLRKTLHPAFIFTGAAYITLYFVTLKYWRLRITMLAHTFDLSCDKRWLMKLVSHSFPQNIHGVFVLTLPTIVLPSLAPSV